MKLKFFGILLAVLFMTSLSCSAPELDEEPLQNEIELSVDGPIIGPFPPIPQPCVDCW